MADNDFTWDFNDNLPSFGAPDPIQEQVDAIGAMISEGDYETIAEESTKVIMLDGVQPTTLAEAHYYRGQARCELGDPRGALDDYTKAIELYGKPCAMVAHILVHRSEACGCLGLPDREMADLNAAIEMPEAPVELHAYAIMARAVIKEKAGDLEGASADYVYFFSETAPEPHDEAWARCNYGWLLFRQGDYEGTIEQTRRGIELAPDIAFGWANIGFAMLKLGRPKEALAEYKKALEVAESAQEVEEMVLGDLKEMEAEAPDTPGLAKIIKLVEKRIAKLAKRER